MEDDEIIAEIPKTNERATQPQQQPSLLTCHICSNSYENPKILSCWHSFCLKCLEEYIPENSLSLVCPLCFVSSVLPASGVCHLPDNCLLSSLELENSSFSDFSTLKSLSDVIKHPQATLTSESSQPPLSNRSDLLISTITLTSLESTPNKTSTNLVNLIDGDDSSNEERELNLSTNQPDTPSSSAIVMDDSVVTDATQSGIFSQSYRSSSVYSTDKMYCILHPKSCIEFYCNDCEVVLCQSCSELEHFGHEQTGLQEAAHKHKVKLQSLESLLKENQQHLTNNHDFIRRTRESLDNNFNDAKTKCLQSFDALQKAFTAKKRYCLERLNSVYEAKSKIFDDQVLKISDSIIDIRIKQEFLEKVLDSERPELILLALKAFNNEVDINKNELMKKIKFENEQPNESSFIEFDNSGLMNLESHCSHVNGIMTDGLLCSTIISLSKPDLESNCYINNITKINVVLSMCDHKNLLTDVYKEKADQIIQAMIIDPNEQMISVDVVQPDNSITKKNSVCYLKFTLKQPGLHSLKVFNYGVPLKGSPFKIKAATIPARTSLPTSPYIKSNSSTPDQRKSFPLRNSQNMTSRVDRTLAKVQSNAVKTPPTSSNLHRSNSSLNRPPWNSSPSKTEQLRRVASTGIVRQSPANSKFSNTSMQSLKARTKQNLKETTKYITSRENRIMNEKIEEEEQSPAYNDANISLDNKFKNMKMNKLELHDLSISPTAFAKCKLSRNTSANWGDHRQLTRSKTTFVKFGQKLTLNEVKRTISNFPENEIINPKMDFKRFGNKGNQLGKFMNVQGVCHKNGQVYITDSKNQCIQVLDVLSGKFVKKFNLSSLPLKLQPFLIGISTDQSGKIYVTDYENHCVLLLDAHGNYLKKIGYNILLGPKGLIIDSQRNLLVIDNRGCCVQTFTAASGELTFRFGIQGYRDEELCRPHFCALSNDEHHVIITDFRSDKVKIFTREGKFVKCFGANGLRGPTGLAVHKKSGDIVVCDFGNSKIQVYKSNGSYMHTVDTSVSQLSGPQGVCFIDDDRILVADSGHHCLKVFNYKS